MLPEVKMAVSEPKTEDQKVSVESNGGLTSEEIQKVVKENDPSLLPPEKQKEFHERFVVKGEEIPEEKPPETEEKSEQPTEEQPKPEVKPEVKTETTPEVKPDKKEKPEPLSPEEENNIKRLREKYYHKSNELNETKLKLQSTNKRLEEIKTKSLTPKENKETDVYSEDYIKGIEVRQKVLEDRQIEREKSEEVSLKTEKARLEFQSDLLEIAQLQVENTSLQTEKPFSALNAAYSRFQTLVGGQENRDKFLSNPEYRKSMEANGIIFPMSDTDWKRYKELLEIRSFKLEKNHPDLDSAYYKWQKENGIIPDSVKEASLEATQKTTQTIANSSQEATILPPNAGTMATASTGWTKETIDAWIATNPYPKTKEDKATMREINEIVQKGLT